MPTTLALSSTAMLVDVLQYEQQSRRRSSGVKIRIVVYPSIKRDKIRKKFSSFPGVILESVQILQENAMVQRHDFDVALKLMNELRRLRRHLPFSMMLRSDAQELKEKDARDLAVVLTPLRSCLSLPVTHLLSA